MAMFNWLRRPVVTLSQHTGVCNFEKLNASADLLRDTVAEVACAASNTAKALNAKYHDEGLRMLNQRMKACFHALNSASDIIIILDSCGNIFFCNDVFINAFNLPDYTSCVGRPVEDVVGKLPKRLWGVVQNNKIWKGKCGKYDINIIPIMNGEPKPIYYTCTLKKTKNKLINIPAPKHQRETTTWVTDDTNY